MGSCLPSFLDRDETLPYLASAVCVIPRSPSSVPLVFLPLYFQLHIPRSLYYDPLFFVFLWLILYWLFPNPLFPSKPTRLWPTDPSVLTEVVPQVQVWYSHPQPPDASPHPTPYFRIIFDTGSFAEPLCPTIPPPLPNVFFPLNLCRYMKYEFEISFPVQKSPAVVKINLQRSMSEKKIDRGYRITKL